MEENKEKRRKKNVRKMSGIDWEQDGYEVVNCIAFTFCACIRLPCWYCCSVSEVLGGLQSELECMRDLVLWVLCWVKLGLRIRWDCGLVIRIKGRGANVAESL
ncbi:hypothetical protein EV2_015228 [Malus domestica]